MNSNRDKIIGYIVSIEMARVDLYSRADFQELYKESQKIKLDFISNIHSLEQENTKQITQYDLLQNNRQLYLPEEAKCIPLSELIKTLRWYIT